MNCFGLRFWLAFLTLVSVSDAGAQGSFGIWTDFNYRYDVKPKLCLGGDGGIRASFDDQNSTTLFIRPTLSYRISTPLEIRGGAALFYTISEANNVLEPRLFQAVYLNWPNLKRIKFESREQLEQRYLTVTGNTEDGMGQESWLLRGRLRFGARTYYFNLAEKVKNAYFSADAELFSNLGTGDDKSFVNQIRVTLAFGQLLEHGYRYEVGLIPQYGRNNVAQGFDRSGFQIRLRLFLHQQP